MPINSKQKGSAYERQIAKLFRDLGYTSCTTSRFSSKEKDDLGIDLCGTGCFSVQAKAWERAPSYHEVLDRMPKQEGNFNLLFHKRNHKGSIVAMTEEDFITFVKLLLKSKVIQPKC